MGAVASSALPAAGATVMDRVWAAAADLWAQATLCTGLARKPLVAVCVGLDGAGKTSLLRRLAGRTGEGDPPPTVGLTTESVVVEGHQISAWDLGGQDRLRRLWDAYLASGVDILIFVVDATDTDRLPVALTELQRVLSLDTVVAPGGPAGDAAVLVLLNKQDAEGARPPEEVDDEWQLARIFDEATEQKRGPGSAAPRWACRGVSVLTGNGIADALHWAVASATAAVAE